MSTRTALLIATDTYEDHDAFGQLRAPQHDVNALAEVLADPAIGGYRIIKLENERADPVRIKINKLFSEAQRDELLLIYISGHGVKDGAGRLHLATTDTRRNLLEATAISAQFVRQVIDQSQARQVVVWLDCCFGGAFPAGLVPRADQTVDVVPQLSNGPGRGCAVMTASTHLQFAFESDEQVTEDPEPSVFTSVIVKGLRTGDADLNVDGEIDANELYSYVYNGVRSITSHQTPTRNDQVTGEICIARSNRGIRLPAALPDEIKWGIRSRDKHFRFAAITKLVELARSDDPHLNSVARQTLQELRSGTDRELARFVEDVLAAPPLPPQEPPPTRPKLPSWRQRAVPSKVVTDFFLWVGLGGLAGISVAFNSIVDLASWLEVSQSTALAVVALYRLKSFLQSGGRELVSRGVTLFKDPIGIEAAVFRPDSKVIVLVGYAQTSVWSTASWAEVSHRIYGPGRCAEFSPNGHLLAIVDHADIALVDGRRSWSPTARLVGHMQSVESLAFSPDGRILASADRAGGIKIWSMADRTLLRTFAGTRRQLNSIAFSPGGSVLVAGGRGGIVTVWDTRDWRVIAELTQHRSFVEAVAFSPDGSILASSSFDGTIAMWDTRTWSLRWTIPNPPTGTKAIAFCPNRHLFAYGCAGNRIRLLRTSDWSKERTFKGHHGKVSSIAFSPNGRLLASTSEDRTVKLWRI